MGTLDPLIYPSAAHRATDSLDAPARRWSGPRVTALVGYVAIASSWVYVIGIPGDPVMLAVWIWGATVAWNVQKPLSHHLDFLKDWWIPLTLLIAYGYSRGLADQLGNDVAVQTPISIDTWLGLGVLPNVRLQEALCDGTCAPTDVQWFDYLFSVTYMSHFFVGLTIAGVLWVRNRRSWVSWMRRYLVLNVTALVVFVAYPVAPPWMAGQLGYIDHPLVRLTSRGWESFGVPVGKVLVGPLSNPVAAMPSLHAGMATLVAVWGISRLKTRLRWLLLLYPLVMAIALVFYADHYVIDVLAGFAAAVLVDSACTLWDRKAAHTAPVPVPPESTQACAAGTVEATDDAHVTSSVEARQRSSSSDVRGSAGCR